MITTTFNQESTLSDVMDWARDNFESGVGYKVGYDSNDYLVFQAGGEVRLCDLAVTIQCGPMPCKLD